MMAADRAGRRGTPGWSWLAWAGLALFGPGAGRASDEIAPEVVRVRVPAARVATYFPPGTPLRTLAVAEFDALVAAADVGGRGEVAAAPPPRVDHFARVEGATLVGRSLVPLPATGDEPAVVACDPWSPALAEGADRDEFARVEPAGRLVLVQPPHRPARVAELAWRQAALADSDGRAYALRLPEAGVAACTLDLPAGVRPTTNAPSAALRRGPVAGAAAGLDRWEFAGATGRLPIFLAPGPGATPADPSAPPRLWVGGTTRVDLTIPGANWAADWAVERPDGAATTLLLALDPGLDLVDVAGPDVLGTRPDPPGQAARFAVTLADAGSNRARSSPLAIRGLVRAPLAGPWLVPSARVDAATWTGGRTVVRLDAARSAVAVEPRVGRRVPPRPDEVAAGPALVFESDQRPGSPAEILLGPRDPGASVAIRGTLRVGAFAPTAEVTATWRADRGTLPDPVLDLPPGWEVGRVGAGPAFAPTPWRVEAAPGPPGRRRVHLEGLVGSSESPGTVAPATLTLTRVAAEPTAGDDLMVAPRVRPPAGPTRVLDERWEVVAEPGWAVEPVTTRGIAWIDPPPAEAPAAAVEGAGDPAPPARGTLTPAPASASASALAWRWADDGGMLTLRRRPDRPRSRCDERVEATLSGGRLRLAWSWTIAEAGRPGSIRFGLDLPPGVEPRWRLVGPGGGQALRPRPLGPEEAAGEAADERGAELALDSFPPGPVALRGEVELPWAGSGPLPLVRFGPAVEVRRSVVVRVDAAARFQVVGREGLEPVGWQALGDGAEAGREADLAPVRAIVGEGQPGLRVAGAWLGTGEPARLEVAAGVEPGPGVAAPVIAEASLRSRLDPGLAARHRLTLRVAPGMARSIELTFPAGATLDRVRRDGQATTAVAGAGTIRLALESAPDPARPTTTLVLDYRTAAAGPAAGRVGPADFLPRVAAPCLSFTWQLNLPERYDAASESPDLLAAAGADAPVGAAPAATEAARTPADEAAARRDLDAALAALPAGAATLGEWLLRLDAGRWPLVIDRIALANVGWGPGSRVDLAAPHLDRANPGVESLRALGLVIEPLGGVLLVSTDPERSAPQRPGREALAEALAGAILAGSDRTDRYQTPARWRGEPTPRSWLASETPDLGLVAPGWLPHRFAAAHWPAASATVAIRDGHAGWRRAGLVAAVLAGVVLLIGPARGLARSRLRRRAAVLGLFACGAATSSADTPGRLDPAGPIVALLPYAGLDPVEAPPGRVVLRQGDHDRLARLARASAGVGAGAEGGSTRQVAATHHVAAPVGRSAAVESRYVLEVAGPGPGSWRVPVGASFDLTATLDGRPAGLKIDPARAEAAVGSIPAGRSVVVVRRLVRVAPGPDGAAGGSAEVAVDRSALARVEVERGDPALALALDGATGPVQVEPGGLAADLGPVDRFTIRWGAAAPAVPEAAVAATVRREARPAGDRLEARLVVGRGRALGSIRLDLDPDLAVVGSAIPGLVGAMTVAGPPGRAAWVALVDPPLGPGTPFDLTFWRPASAGGRAQPPPRWDLVAGHLTATDDAARPAAAADRATAEVNPAGSEPAARTELAVDIEPGRLGFTAESTLLDRRAGAAWGAEARFDGPIRVGRIEAAGLAGWTQPEPDRLRLTFDGSAPAGSRTVRVEGFMAVAPPADDAGRPPTALAPWPRWAGLGDEPGRLLVAGGDGLTVRAGGREFAAAPAAPASIAPGARPARRAYFIPRGIGPLRMRWANFEPRVDVAVRADLRLDATRATWTARVVASAGGGPIRSLHWQLPTAWAGAATLRAAEGGPQPRVRAEIREGATFWTVEADRPAWGRWELTLRSARAVGPGAAFDVPQLAPLAVPGRGSVVDYDLTVTNLTGRSVELGEGGGLVPLTALRTRSDLSAVPGGIISRAFRVEGDPWSLRIKPDSPSPGDAAGNGTRLGRVDFEATIDSAGRVAGRAECTVEPGGDFLPVTLAEGGRLDGASVDGEAVAPVRPTAGAPGRWLVPLGDREPRRVVLQWSGAPGLVGPDATGPTTRPIRLPRFDQPALPGTLRIARTGGAVAPAGGRWTRLDPLAASLDRCARWRDRLGPAIRRVRAEVAPGDLDPVIEPLTAMILELRAVDRTLRGAGPAPHPPLAAWREVEEQAEAAVVAAGLGDCLDRARARAGLDPSGATADRPGVAVPADPTRLRQLGWLEDYVGTTAD